MAGREERISFQEKIHRHRLEIVYRSMLGVFLVAAIIVIVRISIDNKVYSQYEVIKTSGAIGSTDSTILPYGDNAISYSRDGIAAYESDGTQIWNETFEMQSPIVDVQGDYVAVCDYRGNTIYIMDKNGQCGKIEVNKTLLDIKVSAQGVVTATLDDGDITWINVYSSSGEEIVTIRTSMDQTGFPLATSMSEDNRKMVVSYIKTSGNKVENSVAFYNFGDVGQNVQDKIVSGFDYEDTVIPFIHFMNQNEAVAVDEKMLRVYRGSQIPELVAETELPDGIRGIYYGDNRVAVVSRNEEGEDTYRLRVYNMSGNELFSVGFSMEYGDIILKNGYVFVHNESELLIYNKKGMEKYNGSIGEGVKTIMPVAKKNRLIVVRETETEAVKLK